MNRIVIKENLKSTCFKWTTDIMLTIIDLLHFLNLLQESPCQLLYAKNNDKSSSYGLLILIIK